MSVPRLTIDEANRLWVVYRHYYYPEVAQPGRPKSHVEEGWRLYARCLSDKMWCDEAVGLEPNQRDGMQRLALVPEADGFFCPVDDGPDTSRRRKRIAGNRDGPRVAVPEESLWINLLGLPPQWQGMEHGVPGR